MLNYLPLNKKPQEITPQNNNLVSSKQCKQETTGKEYRGISVLIKSREWDYDPPWFN